MKAFTVVMSHVTGIVVKSGVEEPELQINVFEGWPSLEDLRSRIRSWCSDAVPGQIMQTAQSVIVCEAVDDSVPVILYSFSEVVELLAEVQDCEPDSLDDELVIRAIDWLQRNFDSTQAFDSIRNQLEYGFLAGNRS